MRGRTRVAYRWWDMVIAWVIVTIVDWVFTMGDLMTSVRAMFPYRPIQ